MKTATNLYAISPTQTNCNTDILLLHECMSKNIQECTSLTAVSLQALRWHLLMAAIVYLLCHINFVQAKCLKIAR